MDNDPQDTLKPLPQVTKHPQNTRYGYMDEAHQVFDEMYKRDESTFA